MSLFATNDELGWRAKVTGMWPFAVVGPARPRLTWLGAI